MHLELRQAFDAAMAAAIARYRTRDYASAMRHLETAHVLGQRHVAPHVASHYWMLKLGLKRRSVSECWGQLVRIVLGAAGSALGVVPTGNTGGTDIGMFVRRPVPPELRRLIER